MAPEIVRIDVERNSMAKGKLDKDAVLQYDIAFIVDIWSLRICLCIMFNKRYPFNPPSNKIMLKIQKKKNKKYEMTSKIKNKILINLIDQMLIPEPKNRIKIDAILAHPWFSSDKIISMDNSISSKH